MTSDSMLYLSRRDVEEVGLSMREIIEALDRMFREKGEGRVEMPPKPGIHTQPDAFIHAMPAYIPSLGSAGMKWVSGYPGNQKKGLPYITGLLILNDPGKETLMLALLHFDPVNEQMPNRADVGVQAAGYVFASLPLLIVFWFGMKYYIQGITSGAIKA